jgi:EAL domain-containing protein (putative c-di-GMP-specific phosphodiesterase class I)
MQRHWDWLREEGVDIPISLNLPSKALADHRYFEATRRLLAEQRFPAAGLTLEILETDALPREVDITDELARFTDLGVVLAEDDLGSGHSSLNRLRQLPFDVIKLDRGIVAFAGQDPTHTLRFIYQLTRLGHSLGKTVIVEGVETPDLLEAVVTLGADAVQGYVIAKPMPSGQLCAWMRDTLPIRLPAPSRPESNLGKLATLLLWEERLHTLIGQGAAPEGGQDPGGLLVQLETRSASNNPPGLGLALPFEVSPLLLRKLLSCAVCHGLRSTEYGHARQRLVASLV